MARGALHAIGPLPIAGHRPNASLPVVDESAETSDTRVLRKELERLRVLTTKQAVPFDFPMVLRPVLLLSPDTPWTGDEAEKLYLQSGNFTSMLRDSQSVATFGSPWGISWTGIDTPWSRTGNAPPNIAKLFLQSGQFTSSVRLSLDVSSIDTDARGISWDGTNTPITAVFDRNELVLLSGQFSTSVIASRSVALLNNSPSDISWDGTNTPWSGTFLSDETLYLQSEQFTATVIASLDVSGFLTNPTGISWDGNDTLTVNQAGDGLIRLSGQFTTTLHDSQSVNLVDDALKGINTNQRTTG